MLFYIPYLLITLACSGNVSPVQHEMAGIAIHIPCDSVPALNQQIVAFVDDNLHRKVGRGECWDLAATPLNTYRAKWNGKFTYGRLVNSQSECIYPGDIIQFENVVIETVTAGGKMVERMPQHTAIVYKVHAPGQYTIAHQNYGNSRKVILTTLNTGSITRGKAMIYRPLSGS